MTSSYSVGLAYELLVVKVLRRYSFHIQHCGRGGDHGRDFVGQWILPEERVQVVGQCKYRQARSQLAAVRELDSVLARVRGSSGTTAPVGILATNSGFSHGMLKYSTCSKHPMIMCHIVPVNKGRSLDIAHSCDPKSTETLALARHKTYIDTDSNTWLTQDSEERTGLVLLFDMNPVCQKLLPNVQVVSKQHSSYRETLLYYRFSEQNSTYRVNLGAVRERNIDNIPSSWEKT